MRDIIVAGCSFTNFRNLQRERILHGHTPPVDRCFTHGSYPEAIHRNYGNKVYNAGVMGNSVSTSVLSIISIASRLLKEGNTNFSVILQSTDFDRQGIYFPDYLKKIKKIKQNVVGPSNNNYLFGNDGCGFIQFGGMASIDEQNYSECKSITKIAKSFSENIYTPEYCNINALTHILLLQNFCKANQIPYKIFFSSNLFCEKVFPFFDLDKTNVETYFKSFFIDRKLPKKKELGNIKSDPYVFDLFNTLDMDGIWFYETEETKYGGMFEWFFKNNEYKEGDLEYIPLYIEDAAHCAQVYTTAERAKPWSYIPDDSKHMLSIEKAKDNMKNGDWWDMGHPTYYYWEKFVKEVMIDWNLF
jgi:hypothetical protein